ncbi:efflux RND transporter permease subunit, partial [bacterium]|nr:efflux RND transporter permease subunit [bacterium]
MKLPEFSVNRRVTVTMLTILVIILGLVTFRQLALEMMPDLDYPQVTIVTVYPGASSEDIEETVTKLIESAIASVKDIKTLKSESKENFSILSVEFVWGANLDFAAQDLRDAIDLISDQLPDDAQKPMVMKINLSEMPVLMYGVVGAENTYKLRKIIEDEVEPELKHLEGVASVMVMGGKEAQKQIIVDKAKLDQRHISIDDVVKILSAQNLNMPAGHLTEYQNDYLLRTVGEYKSIEEIENTPVSLTQTGNIIYIKDIGKVVSGFKEQRYYIRFNKKPTVMMMVSKESGANTLTATENVKKEIVALEKRLPGNLQFTEIMDMGKVVRQVTSRTMNNAIIGGLLAVLIMFLFLRNWRPTLAISLAIPISIIATFIPIYAAGYSLNIMTLAGLALGVGMLVDNAVVVIENIYRHLELGDDRITAAKVGASEVGMAITASTLTTVSVFFPMMFGGGISGQLIRGLALTVSFSLVASLFVALTIVPLIASVLFKKRSSVKEYEKASGWQGFEKFKNKYLKLLGWTLRHRLSAIGSVAVLFFISVGLIQFMGTEFIPKSDIPMQVLKIKMPVGTELEQTNEVASQLEDIVSKIEEVKVVMAIVGTMGEGMAQSDPSNPGGVNEAALFMKLKDVEDRDRSSDEIMEEIRSKAPKLEGVSYNVLDMSSMMMGGSESDPVAIKIFGKDLVELKTISDAIENRIAYIRGIRDVDNSLKETNIEQHIVIDRDKAFRYGLTVAQIASAVRTATLGTKAGKFRKGGDEIDIRVRLDEKNRNSLMDVEHINIVSPLGFTVPLNQVAKILPGEGPLKIQREHQVRVAKVTANIVGRDLGSTIAEIKEEIKYIEEKLPPGYFIEYGGTYKNMKESFTTLFQALLLAIVLMYVIIASQFESFSHPFVIMFTLPLAVIGVVFLSLITGTTLSVTSFM